MVLCVFCDFCETYLILRGFEFSKEEFQFPDIGVCQIIVADKGVQEGFGRSSKEVVLHVLKVPSVVLGLFYERIEDELLALTLVRQELLLLQNLHKCLNGIVRRFGLRQTLQHILHAAVARLPDDVHHLLLSV